MIGGLAVRAYQLGRKRLREIATVVTPDYDVAPDGQRFLKFRNDTRSGRLNVVSNCAQELQRLVPVK